MIGFGMSFNSLSLPYCRVVDRATSVTTGSAERRVGVDLASLVAPRLAAWWWWQFGRLCYYCCLVVYHWLGGDEWVSCLGGIYGWFQVCGFGWRCWSLAAGCFGVSCWAALVGTRSGHGWAVA